MDLSSIQGGNPVREITCDPLCTLRIKCPEEVFFYTNGLDIVLALTVRNELYNLFKLNKPERLRHETSAVCFHFEYPIY